MRGHQYSFLDAPFPPGCLCRNDFIAPEEERGLVVAIGQLELTHPEMRGGVARRRIAHFGYTYGFNSRRSDPGDPIPAFLLPLRQRVAAWARLAPDALAEALVTEYPRDATIGWHRDAPPFGDVIVGISLLGESRMRFRPYVSPADLEGKPPRRATHEIVLEPRSAYIISGEARRDFEHSIPAVTSLRYSITFRTLRQ